MRPCPLCGEASGTVRVHSAIVAQAFGADQGSVHLKCLEETLEVLRQMSEDPLMWPELLRGYRDELAGAA